MVGRKEQSKEWKSHLEESHISEQLCKLFIELLVPHSRGRGRATTCQDQPQRNSSNRIVSRVRLVNADFFF